MGSRSLVAFVVVTFLSCFAVDGWCQAVAEQDAGGAPTAQTPASAAQAPAPTTQAPAPTAQAAAGPGDGFSVSGGSGFASINGAIGSSPQLSAASTSRRDHAYYARLAAPFQFDDFQFVLSGDYIGLGFHGEPSYDGTPWENIHDFSLFPGDDLRTDLEMNIWRVSGDALFPLTASPGLGVLSMGVRLQWCAYYDNFTVVNLTRQERSEQTRNYGMPGIGVAGSLSLGDLAPGFMSVTPRGSFAATIGKGPGMSYSSFEAFAEIFLTADLGIDLLPASFPFQLPSPGVLFQAGVIFIDITETDDQREADQLGYAPSGSSDYNLWYPVFRVSLGF